MKVARALLALLALGARGEDDDDEVESVTPQVKSQFLEAAKAGRFGRIE